MSSLPLPLPRVPHIMREMGLFAAVGIANTALDFGTLNLLVAITHSNSGVSLFAINIIAFTVSVANSYIWNTRLTFRQRHRDRSCIARFLAVTIIGLCLNSMVLALFAHYLDNYVGALAAVNYGKGCATVFSLIWNYITMRYWVFRSASQQNSRNEEVGHAGYHA